MRAMKDSGIEWVGEIPQEWGTYRIKYCSNIDHEKLNENTNPDYTFQYIDISSVTEYGGINETSEMTFEKSPSRARMIVKHGDTIISTVRTYLKAVAYIDSLKDHVCSTGFCVLSPKKDLFPKFAYYVLQSEYVVQKIVSESVGVSYPAISSSEIGNIKIALPKYSLQARIADYLDSKCAEIDALIAAKEKTNALLKERRQSIIYEAVTKGLNPYVPMKDSGIELIGEIPEEWDVIRLKYLLSSGKDSMKAGPFGSSLTSSDMQGSDVKVFTQRTVLDNDFENGNEAVSVEKSQELKGFIAEEGDILITTRGTIGKTAIVPEGKRGVIHPCLIKMQIDEGKFSKKLLCKIFNETSILSEQLRIASNATTIDVVYTQNLMNMFIPIASIKEQKRIDEYLTSECSTIDRLISTNNTEISKLKEYRQSLIYEAVTGKIEV